MSERESTAWLRALPDRARHKLQAVTRTGFPTGEMMRAHSAWGYGRIFPVVVLFAAGWWADHTVLGQQLGSGLHYFAIVLMSLAISNAVWFAMVNWVPAVLWLVLPFPQTRKTAYERAYHVVTWVNRTLGHVEAFGLGALWVVVTFHEMKWQLCLLAALHFWAEPTLDRVALWWIRVQEVEKAAVQGGQPSEFNAGRHKTTGRIHWTRRPLINAATIVAALLIWRKAPDQVDTAWPLLVAVAGGACLRLVKWYRSRGETPGEETSQQSDDDCSSFRESQAKAAWADTPVLLALSVVLAVGFLSFRERQLVGAAQMRRHALADPRHASACYRETRGPVTADVEVFVIADTQLHKLDGARFPGQMELIDAVVPVARRPVELDLLAGATVRHFGIVYQKLQEQRAKQGRDLPWIHLGDMTDLACVSEYTRVENILRDYFKPENAAGVSIGNHDNAFTGNFAWSPYWTDACTVDTSEFVGCEPRYGNGRLSKAESDSRLLDFWGPNVSQRGGQMKRFYGRSAGKLWRRGQGVVTVTPLGSVDSGGQRRAVLGVFLDTTDSVDSDFGIAGMAGILSEKQVETLTALIDEVATGQREDPYFVFFAHHPVGDLSSAALEHLSGLVTDLEKEGPRVIGFVAAHTHRAQERSFCLGGRRFDELIVGSTLDPPQEAGILSIGKDSYGRVAMALSTVPAVGRDNMDCLVAESVSGQWCKKLMSQLSNDVACQELFERDDEFVGRDCQAMEQNLSAVQRIDVIPTHGAPRGQRELLQAQRSRAQQLFRCLCRVRADGNSACDAPPDRNNVLCAADYVPRIDQLARDDQARKELVCVSWAASVVQAHKANGMEIADALRCGFDDRRIQAARIMTTRLADRACY